MKILILSMKFLPASGGSASYAYNLALGLHNEGHDVRMLAPAYRRTMNDQEFPFPVKRMMGTAEGRLFRMLMAPIYVWRAYRRFRPDCIWTSSFAGCRVLATLPWLRCMQVGTIHGGGIHRRYPSKDPLGRIGDRLGLRFMQRADALVTVSEESKKLFVEKIRKPGILAKVRVIYSSIPINETSYMNKETALQRLPQFKDRQVVLTVARLIRAKGHDTVIEAIGLLRDRFPALTYVIVGEGPEKKALQQLVAEKGLNPIVVFAGYVDDQMLEAYYGVSDIFVMAGRWTESFVEGFGLVFTEAGIRGKAVIGTRIGGIPEAIDENKTGLIVEPDNPGLLAEKMEELLKDETRRAAMGDYARAWNKQNFANEVMGRNNSRLIQDLNEIVLTTT